MFMPTIVRLIKMVRVLWKKKVPWTKDNVHTRDGRTCQYCHTKLEARELTIDHIVPKDQGGGNSWQNTVTACFPCNNKKDNRTPSQAKMYLRRRPYQPTIMEFTLKKLELDGLTKVLEELFEK
jgi:5-methylcytosine-specific restriction endonuclease McrA